MSTPVIEISDGQKLFHYLFRDNINGVFTGGDLSDPQSPIRQRLDPGLKSIVEGVHSGDSSETITEDAYEDYFGDGFLDLLYSSYMTLSLTGNWRAAIPNMCAFNEDPEVVKFIIPLSAFDRTTIVKGDAGQGDTPLFASMHFDRRVLSGSSVGNLVTMNCETGEEGDPDAPVKQPRALEGLRNYRDYFRTIDDGYVLNVTNNDVSTVVSGLEDRVYMYFGEDKASHPNRISNVGIGIRFDSDCEYSDDPSSQLYWAVITRVELRGDDTNEGPVRIGLYVASGNDDFIYAVEVESRCGGDITCVLDEGLWDGIPSCDGDLLFTSYEEAHEAYPDLFPLDSDTGLSATKKHFIRIS